jgi:transcriptional regulatory protein LEU3
MEALNYRAVLLHLRLYAFFDTTSPTSGRSDLLDLYFAATAFLDRAFAIEETGRLHYVPNYIMQMILAAGFTLLKLLNSDFAPRLPAAEEGRRYFLRTVNAVRSTSVMPNDLPVRLAEVLAQLWKASGGGGSVKFHSTSQSPGIGSSTLPNMFATQPQPQPQPQPPRRSSDGILQDPLRLMVRSRMSMSVVFDSVWRWRETQVNGAAEHLDTTVVNNPTNPDSSSNSTPPPGTVMESVAGMTNALYQNLGSLSLPLPMANGLASANSYEFFDPVSWMLDVQPDWNAYGTFGNEFGA